MTKVNEEWIKQYGPKTPEQETIVRMLGQTMCDFGDWYKTRDWTDKGINYHSQYQFYQGKIKALQECFSKIEKLQNDSNRM